MEALEALEAANEDISRELESKLFQDLELYEVAGGFVDVIGPGVEVIIDDGTRISNIGKTLTTFWFMTWICCSS